ncbi:hypothetical protein [Dyella tabacisoli]|uniref:Uncharacterized protein n=1 Tax=Dyella tabacisoli TaxID=2282381 RepID=A0A369UPQ5_9GAMM|nr:hypothetical protein [Dyella tabacisoli]RDD82313.1 hypothetical protein DVJ77_07830 [Dyella tabacisoli]
MRRLASSLSLTLLLAACSPSAPAPTQQAAQPSPAHVTLGSAQWYAWVDQTLGISDDSGHGPDPGSDEWNQAVQHKLDQEAPQSKPGSPEWQQAVDALLRTRATAER